MAELRLANPAMRWMAQLGAALREHVAEPDQWQLQLSGLGSEDHEVIELRFRRVIGERQWSMIQCLSFEMVGVMPPDFIARYEVRKWHEALAEARA